jgi:hypothetical protein
VADVRGGTVPQVQRAVEDVVLVLQADRSHPHVGGDAVAEQGVVEDPSVDRVDGGDAGVVVAVDDVVADDPADRLVGLVTQAGLPNPP